MCHNADQSWERRRGSQADSETHQNQALLPHLVVRKGRKRVALKRKIRPERRYSWWKRNLTLPFNCKWQKRAVDKEPNCTFLFDKNYLNFQVAEISAQWSMVETNPQLSWSPSSNLETSEVGEIEKPIRKKRSKNLEVIYHSDGFNNLGIMDFLSFARSMRLFQGIKNWRISGKCSEENGWKIHLLELILLKEFPIAYLGH